MRNLSINSISQWNGSYNKRLVPYILISLILHSLGIGIFYGLDLLLGSGRGISIAKFEAGLVNPNPSMPNIRLALSSRQKRRIFRVDFFKEIIPWQPETRIEPLQPSSAEPEPEIKKLAETPKEKQNKEIENPPLPAESQNPPIEHVPTSQEESISESSGTGEELLNSESQIADSPYAIGNRENNLFNDNIDNLKYFEQFSRQGYKGVLPLVVQPILPEKYDYNQKLPDRFQNFPPTDSMGNQGIIYPLPSWALTDAFGVSWVSNQFLGNYTIYLLGDVSSRFGFEDLLAWNWVLKKLITNPYSAWPPYMVTIASTIQNPYAYTELRVSAMLKKASKDESTFGVLLVDRENTFAHSLGYFELKQPIVIFTDENGFIRMIMIGRIRDISTQNIQATMEVISDMWQWTPEEKRTLPPIINVMINYLRERAYDAVERAIPPEPHAHEIAPSWGYPVIPQFNSISNDSINLPN